MYPYFVYVIFMVKCGAPTFSASDVDGIARNCSRSEIVTAASELTLALYTVQKGDRRQIHH